MPLGWCPRCSGVSHVERHTGTELGERTADPTSWFMFTLGHRPWSVHCVPWGPPKSRCQDRIGYAGGDRGTPVREMGRDWGGWAGGVVKQV